MAKHSAVHPLTHEAQTYWYPRCVLRTTLYIELARCPSPHLNLAIQSSTCLSHSVRTCPFSILQCVLSAHDIMTDWRMQLNNYLQSNGGARLLTWEVYQSGPQHQPSWTAIAYSQYRLIWCYGIRVLICICPVPVRGVEYGRSSGSSQNAVKEEAARQTLAALYADRGAGR